MTQTHEITTGIVDVGDARLRYRERGTGAPVVLLHAGGFGEWFAPVFDEPALDGVRLVEVRRAGYGDSSTPETHLTFADHARQARTLLREIGIERATWVGHSSSASMALQAAIDAPEAVARLVLLEPAPSPAGPSSEELVRTAVGPAVGAAQSGDLRGAVDAFLTGVCGPDWADGRPAAARRRRDGAHRPRRPLLLRRRGRRGDGVDDRRDRPRRPSRRRRRWSTAPRPPRRRTRRPRACWPRWMPNAELIALPGVGHSLPLEDPAAVARLIATAAAT